MLKIGEFSRMSQVSVRMLRHYDEMGLLRPAHVDPESGYRFYAPPQLEDMHRLLALRDLGFSLEEVGHLLRGGLSPDEVRGMLKLKRAELRQQLDEGNARLHRIETRLAAFEGGGGAGLPDGSPEIIVRRVEEVPVASCRAVVADYTAGGGLRDAVRRFLEVAGVRPPHGFDRGYYYVYHDPEYRERRIDVEAAYPLPDALPRGFTGDGHVRVGALAAAEAACVIHRGDVWAIGHTYSALGIWMAANGYRVAGPSRTRAVQRGGAPEDYVTEVVWPVERAEA